MYQLKFGSYTLYDPRDDTLAIRNPSVHLGVNEAGSMAFTIDDTHPYVNRLSKMKCGIELLSDGSPIFRGRITGDIQAFDLSRDITVEGQLACLNDSIVEPFDFPGDYADDAEYAAAAESGNVVEFWLSKLIASHNAQVTEDQQINLGVVTVADPNNYISRSSIYYATTWSTLTEKLSGSSLGGYFLVRYEIDGTYLDYLADFPLSNTQGVAYAENLLDLTDENDTTDIYTAILPVGSDGLTIAALPDGDLTDDLVKDGKVIYSKSAIAAYGRITSEVNWDDVTIAENLQTKAAALLAQSGVLPLRTITVTAVDLHYTDEQIAALRVGRYTPVTSAPHTLNSRYAITSLDPDILDPGNTRITFGFSKQTQTERTQAALSDLTAANDQLRIQLNKQENDLTILAQSTETRLTEALQNSREIVLSALAEYAMTSDLNSFRETVEAQLSILADQVKIELGQTADRVEEVNGDLQSQYAELTQYYRFTLDGMIIGKEDNEMTLQVQNNRISILQSGLEVAYFSDRKLYITDGQFLYSLRIGNFELVPRANGNLSLRKVAGT